MYTPAVISHKFQRVICMMLAAVIVSSTLSLGAYGVHQAAHEGYSVTVTQLQ